MTDAKTTSPLLLSSLVAKIPIETWDQAVHQLHENSGVALVDLLLDNNDDDNNDDMILSDIPRRAFRVAGKTLDLIQNNHGNEHLADMVPTISEQANSAHVTGYHPAASVNSLSRYNQYREGFVWSDGHKLTYHDDDDDKLFAKAMDDLEALLHAVAEQIIHGLERYLELSEGWVEDNLGPTRQSSQWHLKRYVLPLADTTDNKEKGEFCNLLPSHTDPSLISVVIHDRPGKSEGSQGLEYFHKSSIDGSSCEWRAVPYSGHKVAVVFVGSVLAHITGGFFPACKHRVVRVATSSASQEHYDDREHARMAATLFVRPRGTALVQVPPSPCLENNNIHIKRQITFDTWYARVARNYEKAKLRVHRVDHGS